MTHYPQLTQTIIDELRRFKLSHREQNLATVICYESFGNGMDAVAIPNLQTFGEFTGFSPNNVCETLKRLQLMRIITVDDSAGIPKYAINTNTDTWQVAPRVGREQIKRAKEAIRRFNNLPSNP